MSSEQEETSDALQDPLSIQEIVPSDNLIDTLEEVLKNEDEDKSSEENTSNAEQDNAENNDEVQNIIENITNENKADQVTPKPNRELKSILELSKEANLDTNIVHKRKIVESNGKQQEKAETINKRRNSSSSGYDYQKMDKKLKIQALDPYPNVRDMELPSSISDNEEASETKEKDDINSKINKRKRSNLPDSSIGGALNEHGKRNRKLSTNLIITMNNKKKDPFCWRCHHGSATVHCETCPRSYHSKCLKQNISQPNHWLCPECVTILKAENLKQRSPAMRDMSLEHLCGLLKFALKRMLDVSGCEPFIHPVSESDFPEYRNYIVQPMDLTCLEKNIKDNVYGSTQAFEADAKWILHNSIIFNSYQSKLTSIAKSIIKICKQEMSEIENCPTCYLNANTKKKTWFIEVCPKPHLLVWAKLKGFPYWPAKAMRTNSQGFVDVRFFGAHDRAWVPFKECFLYSSKDPNSSKVKRNDIIESIKELNVHIENLKRVYGEFRYAPYRVTFEPEQEIKQLEFMLPKYNPDAKPKQTLTSDDSSTSPNKRNSNGTTSSSDVETDAEKSFSDSEANEESREKIPDREESEENDDSLMDSEDMDEMETEHDDKTYNLSKAELEEIILSSNTNNEHTYSSVTGDSNTYISSPNVRGGKVRMRGGYTNTSGKIKVIPKVVTSDSENKKRLSCDEIEIETSTNKLSRRNSDQSVKSDSSRLSNISDKINKVDISENMEISLGNDAGGSLTISENISPLSEFGKLDLPEISIESKRKPVVQVNIGANENAEFTISPQSKSKIADKLMKKLAEPLEDDIDNFKLESVKKQIIDNAEETEKPFLDVNESVTETDLLLENFKNKDLTVLEKITELSPDTEIFETNTELPKVSDSNMDEASKEIEQTIEKDKETENPPTEIMNKESEDVDAAVEEKLDDTKEKQNDAKVSSLQNNNVSDSISSNSSNGSSDDESPESSDVSSKKESEVSSNSSSEKSDSSVSSDDKIKNDEDTNAKSDDTTVVSSNIQSKIEQYACNKSSLTIQPKSKEVVDTTISKEVSTKKISLSQVEIKLISDNSQKKVDKPIQQKLPSQSQPESITSQESRKRKRSTDNEDNEKLTDSPLQKRLVKVVNIEDIKNKNLESFGNSNSSEKEQSTNKSILENRLNTGKTTENNCQNRKEELNSTTSASASNETNNSTINANDLDTVHIKNEPLSDDEPCDREYMELKRKYLSALNLNESEKTAEKPKQHEIRTRSKTEERKFKVVDNLSKVIDDVATHYSAEHANEEITLPPKRKEIFIKPLSKMQMPKQRARKSFPAPIPLKSYQPATKKDVMRTIKPAITSAASILTQKSISSSVTITTKPLETLSNAGNVMFLAPPPTVTNSITILPPNQPITYTANIANPVLTMVQHPIGTALSNVYIPPPLQTNQSASVSNTATTEGETSSEIVESQNYIPQSGASSKTINTSTSISRISITSSSDTITSTMPPLASLSSQTATTNSSTTASSTECSTRSTDILEDLQVLNSFMPETLTKSISEIMCRVPPTLKPRPPGPLSTQFDEGLPSSAGVVTSRINSISHRLGDYFRGMLIELLQEMGRSDNPEAEITRLKLENEELKHKHAEEILEIKKNISSVLKDIQKSLTDERNRVIDETRSACETECLKRVEEAKSKQWCANCSKEAQFYCCWNTSYCDYPCQQKHWPKHMSKCTQNIQNSQLQASNSTAVTKSQTQPLVLRPTTAPKGFTKTIIAKPTKVFVNRTNKNAFNVVRTSGNHITLVEATPGNFELLGNGGPISIGGKFISSVGKIKTSNIISVTSPSNSGSSVVTCSAQGQKSIFNPSTSNKSYLASSKAVVLSDDDGD
ncbi:hypothetical protein ILUMI_05198 [Ignelater luminosus]|uniref:Protein kinase C-binding protein 1 n=1 Tax=Ignelater luminosus TaxID=2038154 RepID=A0A8K0D7I7_IGNLU|nr:hypothetical protein ILUMI_05198 [Ignelater luminosus]